MAEYWESDDLKQMAERLIAAHHSHLATAKIGYLMRDKAARKNLTLDKSEQQIVRGKSAKLGGGRLEVLTGKDFTLEVPHDEWQQWSTTQREFVVDTLLSQFAGEEDDNNGGAMKFFTIPFPVAVFPDVIRRYGMPFDELRDCYRVMRDAEAKANAQITTKT